MKTKFLLPVLALIFATGMSFATANLNADPDFDFIQRNGWERIDEVDCNPQGLECFGISGSDGQLYQIFDSQDENDPKEGAGETEPVPIP